MRKITVLTGFFLILFIFFACSDLRIPTAIEIRGNPELKFAAKMNMGDVLSEYLEIDEFELISCVNTKIRTYMLRMNLLDEDFDLSSHRPPGLAPGGSTSSAPLIPLGGNDATILIDFSTVLPGFSLKDDVTARVFVYGSGIKDAVQIELEIDDIPQLDFEFNKQQPSVNGDKYPGTTMPGSASSDFYLTLGNIETKVKFNVFIPANEYLSYDWFEQDIYAELLIWLPMEFIADADAEVIFPAGFLFSEDDLFGRSSGNDSNPLGDFIERLELIIKLNQNPFIGKKFIIWSDAEYDYIDEFSVPQTGISTIEIRSVLTGNSFNMLLSEKTMEEINDPKNYPFAPKFKFVFLDGDILAFPWDFRATEFAFKAKINYRITF